MQAYSRTNTNVVRRLRAAPKWERAKEHKRQRADERSSKVAKMLYAVIGPASHGYVDQD